MAPNQMAPVSGKAPSREKSIGKMPAEEVGQGGYQAVANQTLDRIFSGEAPGMRQFVRGFHFIE